VKYLRYVTFLKIRKIFFLYKYFVIFDHNTTEVFSQTDVSGKLATNRKNMNSGICTWKDLIEFISYCVAIISLVGFWYSYLFSKKQIHFPVMEKCISTFREMTKPTGMGNDYSLDYIEFVNEEFFYLENDYIPLQVGIEWIDGMINYLPFFYEKQFIESNRLQILKEKDRTKKILHDYPRVRKAIQLKKDIDFSKIHLSIDDKKDRKTRRKERDKLIYEILNNLKIPWWKKIGLKRIIASR
jgi:hypothetical protein